MIVAVGVDLVEVERIARLRERQGERFLRKVYTAAERDECLRRRVPDPSLAARFAAKEAVMKCLGTGWAAGVAFDQIEVRREPSGAVAVALSGTAASVARDRGIAEVHLSLSHTAEHAIAYAVAVSA